MKRGKYFSFVLLMLMIIALISPIDVGAITYTSYKKGDEIEIKLTDALTSKFYVIEDSNQSSDTVKAIYKEFFNPTVSYSYKEAEKAIESLKSSWVKVTSVSLPTMVDIFGSSQSLKESFNFNVPTWGVVNKNNCFYWTSTPTSTSDIVGHWAIEKYNLLGGNYLGIASGHSDDTKGYLRPVVNVKKDNVVGGVINTEPNTKDEFGLSDFKIDVSVTDRALNMLLSSGNVKEGTRYYVKFVSGKDEKLNDLPKNVDSVEANPMNNNRTTWNLITTFDVKKYVTVNQDWYMLKGYDYAYFMACNSEKCVASDEPIKVERPSLPELSKRYEVFNYEFGSQVGSDALFVVPNFPWRGKDGSHQINVKIGKINDEKLLYSIYKGEKDALVNLMEYAKKNNGITTSANDTDFYRDPLLLETELKGVKFDSSKIENEAYYFIYTEYENSDNLYRDLSDITIAQGKNRSLSYDIKWDFEESPSTGESSTGSDTKDEFGLSDFKIKVDSKIGDIGFNMVAYGGNFKKETNYYVKFVNSKNEKITNLPQKATAVDYDSDDIMKWKSILEWNDEMTIEIASDWYMLKGYEYAYFMACNEEKCVVSNEPIKVERPSLPELSKRYYIHYKNADSGTKDWGLFIAPQFPYDGTKNGSHIINVKIGKINDEKLIYSIYKGEGKASISTSDNYRDDIKVDKLKIENGAYYYIYTEYENSDNLYRDLSDIAIAYGKADFLSNDIKWDYEKNPSTGDVNMYVLFGGMLLVIGLGVVSYKKLKVN